MGQGGYKKILNVCRFNNAFRKKGKIKNFGRKDGEDNLRRKQTTIIKSFFFTELNLKFGKIRYLPYGPKDCEARIRNQNIAVEEYWWIIYLMDEYRPSIK